MTILSNELIHSADPATKTTTRIEDEYSNIPLCIDDIITICKEYAIIGQSIQHQIDNILEFGVEESIKQGIVNRKSFPYIKGFLQAIMANPYFGEAAQQAEGCLWLIKEHEEKAKKALSLLN